MASAIKDLDFCKKKGIEIQDDKNPYVGLAVIRTSSIRALGSEVIDSRNVYEGHADIKHGYVPEKGKPLPGELTLRIDNLIKHTKYEKDPDVNAPSWTGINPLNPPENN